VAIELSIIVPVFNEAENILPLAREVAGAMKSHPATYELVFVDDASTDETWGQIQQARQENPRVRGLRHSRNSGQSAALCTGFQATTSPVLATLDGDRQNDPADLPQLLAALGEADVVAGIRVARQDNWLRRVSSNFAQAARKWILQADVRDMACGVRVFKRTALAGIFPFNGLHRFMPLLMQINGARLRQIPVHHRPRTAGVSKYGLHNRLWRGLHDLVAIRWYQKRRLLPVPFQELS
jgi:dolichol-phosphate mannosyltransferase